MKTKNVLIDPIKKDLFQLMFFWLSVIFLFIISCYIINEITVSPNPKNFPNLIHAVIQTPFTLLILFWILSPYLTNPTLFTKPRIIKRVISYDEYFRELKLYGNARIEYLKQNRKLKAFIATTEVSGPYAFNVKARYYSFIFKFLPINRNFYAFIGQNRVCFDLDLVDLERKIHKLQVETFQETIERQAKEIEELKNSKPQSRGRRANDTRLTKIDVYCMEILFKMENRYILAENPVDDQKIIDDFNEILKIESGIATELEKLKFQQIPDAIFTEFCRRLKNKKLRPKPGPKPKNADNI